MNMREIFYLQGSRMADPSIELSMLGSGGSSSPVAQTTLPELTVTIHPVSFRNYYGNVSYSLTVGEYCGVFVRLEELIKAHGVNFCSACGQASVLRQSALDWLKALESQSGMLLATVEMEVDCGKLAELADIFDFFDVSAFILAGRLFRQSSDPTALQFQPSAGQILTVELVVQSISLPLSDEKQSLVLDLIANQTQDVRLRYYDGGATIGDVYFEAARPFICMNCNTGFASWPGERVLQAGARHYSLRELSNFSPDELIEILQQRAELQQEISSLLEGVRSLAQFGLAKKNLLAALGTLSSVETLSLQLACFDWNGFRECMVVLPVPPSGWDSSKQHCWQEGFLDLGAKLNTRLVLGCEKAPAIPEAQALKRAEGEKNQSRGERVDALIESWRWQAKAQQTGELLPLTLAGDEWQDSAITIARQNLYVVQGGAATGKSSFLQALAAATVAEGDRRPWQKVWYLEPAFSRSKKVLLAQSGALEYLLELFARTDEVRRAGLGAAQLRARIENGEQAGDEAFSFKGIGLQQLFSATVGELFDAFWEHEGVGDILGSLCAFGLSDISAGASISEVSPLVSNRVEFLAACNEVLWSTTPGSRRGRRSLVLLDGGFEFIPASGQELLLGLLQQLLQRGITVFFVSEAPFFAMQATAVIEMKCRTQAGRRTLSYTLTPSITGKGAAKAKR